MPWHRSHPSGKWRGLVLDRQSGAHKAMRLSVHEEMRFSVYSVVRLHTGLVHACYQKRLLYTYPPPFSSPPQLPTQQTPMRIRMRALLSGSRPTWPDSCRSFDRRKVDKTQAAKVRSSSLSPAALSHPVGCGDIGDVEADHRFAQSARGVGDDRSVLVVGSGLNDRSSASLRVA